MSKLNPNRWFGILRLTLSLIWASLSVVAAFYGNQYLQVMQERLETSLHVADTNLTTLTALVTETQDVLLAVETSLDTAHQTTVDLSLTLTDARPLVSEATQVITNDIPSALDDVQASMPSLIATAAAVDETLSFLSGFQFAVPIPLGPDLNLGLGINYAPEVPLEAALETLSGNLETIPAELRSLADDFDTTNTNLLTLRDDVAQIADDLYLINQQLQDVNPQLTALENNLNQLQQQLEQTRPTLATRVETLRSSYLALLALIFLSQIPAAYQSIMMIRFSPHHKN